MKTLFSGFFLSLYFIPFSQININSQWTWVKGDSTSDSYGVYGIKGTPSVTNKPGSRKGSISWMDSTGNFWLFGGEGYTLSGNTGQLNDLWKYNPNSHQWTWISGDSTRDNTGIYGTKGIASSLNKPKGRQSSISWTDASGIFWLFGGYGSSSTGANYLNDLWKYNPNTNMWTWVSGDSIANQLGIYGTLGSSSSTNKPGGRYYSTSWTDASGIFWLFGGAGVTRNGNGFLNDLWKYSLVTNQWTWMKGDTLSDSKGVYGQKGANSLTNKPGARLGSTSWTDGFGNFWLFGGVVNNANGNGTFSDLWKYNIANNQWAWVTGDSTLNNISLYGIMGINAIMNKPGGRSSSISWTDASGSLWLFGGYGNTTNTNGGYLNDLWKFDPIANQWGWIKGDSTLNSPGVYGMQETATSINKPGSRALSIPWKDSVGNFWLFGGTNNNYLNDLWKLSKGTTSSPSDYFRSVISGNWNSPSTWESSPVSDFSSGLASPATLTPDNNSNGITIRNGHTVTVTANISTDHTVVNPGGVLTVTGGTLAVLNSGLIIKSDSSGSARIGNSSGSISGNVIVQRYIPSNASKAWRLISVPTTTTQTINAAWQNGQAAGVAGPAGAGTIITGNNGNSSFDYQTLGNSMLTYNSSADKFSGIASTTSPIATDNGYFLFVRGDRTATPSNGLKTATTLSTTGNLKQGNYPATPISVTATQFGLIGNPYASQIDFKNVTKSAGIDNTFWVWDPKLAGSYGLGAYQTLTLSGSNYIITPGGGSYGTSGSTMNTIESGQAFFVHATSTGTVSFTENTKSTGYNNVFRTSSTPAKSLITNLYSVESAGDELTDGTMNLFDNNYSNLIDGMDALKLTNFGVNLGITEDDKILSVEKRKDIKDGDVILYNLNNTKPQQYRFEFIANGLNYSGLSALLIDNYLKTNTPVDLNGSTSVTFAVTSDTASSAANRFSIVFGKPSFINTKPSIVVYPNPVINGNIKLQFSNMPKGNYNVKVVNTAGQAIAIKQINHAEGTSIETISVNKITGAYLLEIINPNKTKSLNKVIIN